MKTELMYFELAKQLNKEHHEKLYKINAHFRGNINSLSLISLDKKTPEIGISGIKSKEDAVEELSAFSPKKPNRGTPEKALQSWIILHAINNNNILPFGKNLTFITSELAIVIGNKRIVNDILAINQHGDLVVIELKSKRVNEVKQQALDFKEIINGHKEFFAELTKLVTDGKEWNGEVRCMIVWPEARGEVKSSGIKYPDIEEYVYEESYSFAKVK